ncbi:MAG: methionyl-tRNA formyltransferase [Paracoccaceae bacterium]|jgi:methionyl-tRNA formyltransferase
MGMLWAREARGPRMPFLIWPDPRLVTSAAPVIRVDASVRADYAIIEAAMAVAGLPALSGPQVGVMRRLAVAPWDGPRGGALRLTNFKLIWASKDSAPRLQSCPCLPGVEAMVPRATVVTARWLSEAGDVVERVLTGARAAEAQLLADHLDGATLLDRLGPEARRGALRAITRARLGPGAATQGVASDGGGARPPTAEACGPEDLQSKGHAMRLIFMGTPQFSVAALDALVDAGHDVAAVYTQPPRPAGRGKKPRPSPVQLRAEALGLEVRSPKSLRPEDEQQRLRDLGADVAVVVAYGLILPQGALDAPRLGSFNIHASLLPRWRGAAPIQRAIMAGDPSTGVCIMRMEVGLDTGPVIVRRVTGIGAADTSATVHDRLAQMGATMIVAAMAQISDGSAHEDAQPEDGVTYAAKIDKAEAKIDWTRPAEEVDRAIRGLSPFPGAWFDHDGARIKALGSSVEAGEGAPGEVLDDALLVACGQGAVRLTRIQRAGKGVMTTEDALRGTPIPAGTMLA